MIELQQQKEVIIQRIISHLNPVPANAVNELFQQSLPDLTRILDKLATTRDQEQVEEATLARAQEAIRASKLDHAWAYALLKVSLNGKYLQETEANKSILEGMLQPHEEPSPALYSTLLKQFSNQFSWAVPQPIKSAEDRQAEFARICREHLLSECEANKQLHKDGVSLDAWVGASGIERARYANEHAQARQHFLVHSATPQQLKEEARFQSVTERDIAVKAEADRQHQFVAQQQQGLYSTLPSHNQAGEVMDSAYFRKLSTVNFAAFKVAVKKWGTAQITSRLRGEN